jgi:hypothetical protein
VSDQDSTALTEALNRALAGARSELTVASPLSSTRMADLADELQAALTDLVHGYHPGGR